MGRKVKDEKSGWMRRSDEKVRREGQTRRSDEKVRMRRLNKKVG